MRWFLHGSALLLAGFAIAVGLTSPAVYHTYGAVPTALLGAGGVTAGLLGVGIARELEAGGGR